MNQKRVLIDDVFFQIHTQPSGIARLWKELLTSEYFKCLLEESGIQMVVLSRSGLDISGGLFDVIRFPTYAQESPALDSLLLDEICVKGGFKLFISTYFTFPTLIPTWIWCYDLIPEVICGPEILNHIGWQQRSLALLNCQNFVSISNSTKADLFKYYPHSENSRNQQVAYPWVSRSMLSLLSQQTSFDNEKSKEKPFVLMVGSRHQLYGYKNGEKLFFAANCGAFPNVDIVCVGGEPLTEEESSAGSQFGVKVRRVLANDDELLLLYTKAIALISLSKYEGFGIPIIESLACGTPVISLANSSLREAGGDKSIYMPDDSPHRIKLAIEYASKPKVRMRSREYGPIHAESFSMESSTERIVASLSIALEETENYSESGRSMWWRNQIELLSQIEI
jgi:glycosyltransferase involved in cell wall biosynthesis